MFLIQISQVFGKESDLSEIFLILSTKRVLNVLERRLEHGTIISTEMICKKIPFNMHESA